MARQARLGKPRAPIEVTSGADGVRIEIPVRRTRFTWALWVPTFAWYALVSVVGVGVTLWMLVSTVSGGGHSLIVWFVLLVMLLLMAVLYGFYPLMALGALYMLFGTTVVALEAGKFSMRNRVGRLSASIGRLGDVQFDPVVPIVVEARQDRRGLSYVHLEQGVGRWGHAADFGVGNLSQAQAVQIAEALRDVQSGRVEPALPPDASW